MDCLFCKIGNGEASSQTLYEDTEIRIFKNIHPKAPIHLLVIPKSHIASIAHMEDNHREIISKIIFAAKRQAKVSGLKGYKLVFNVGREGGQVIDHLHLHLLGGWKDSDEKVVNF